MANGIYFKCDQCGYAYHHPKGSGDIKLPKGWIKMEMDVVTVIENKYNDKLKGYVKDFQEVDMCSYKCAESFLLMQSELMEQYKKHNGLSESRV